MSFGNRRKRGRPRRGDVPPINDIDLALIREFQERPAFYDRTHPQYRNREYLEPLWLQMSHNLGQNVAVVKNRMIQLRNRYNLEKRRVEALQRQYNDPDITPQWPLYEHLSFLGDHIKTRRSFTKPMLPLRAKQQPTSNSSDSEDCDDAMAYESSKVLPSQQQVELQHVPLLAKFSDIGTDMCNGVVSEQTLDDGATSGTDKFKAFGQFLASSLIEMNEKDALRLVEKFTSELVKSMLSEASAHALSAADDLNTTPLLSVNSHQYGTVRPVATLARMD